MVDEINLIDIDVEADEVLLVSMYEAATGKILYPAQDERIMLSVINQQSTLNKIKFNEGLKQCFPVYATGIFLDLYGELLDCPRLVAQCAVDTLRVNLYETFSMAKTILKGAEIETKDGEYLFVTTEDLIIPAGSLFGTVAVKSKLAGAALNVYAAGEINTLITDYDYVESVINVDGASGGIDSESDADYKERLLLAPEKFSTAGPAKAYEYFAKSAHPSIIDVKVESSSPGVVDVYLLTTDGVASSSVQAAAFSALNADKVRPLTDNVRVHSCEAVGFTLSANVLLTATADETITKAAVNLAIANYFASLKKKLGLELVPSQMITAINSVAGVYKVELNAPVYTVGSDSKYFNGTIGTLTFGRAV